MASWGSCDFHELRDLNERIKAAASEPEMDKFYTELLDKMMNDLLADVIERTPPGPSGHLHRNWFTTKARRSGKHYRAEIYNNIEYARSLRTATGRRSDGMFRLLANVWFAVSLKESTCCAMVCSTSRKLRPILSRPKARNSSAA